MDCAHPVAVSIFRGFRARRAATACLVALAAMATPALAQISGVNNNITSSGLKGSGYYTLPTLDGLGGDLTVESWVYLDSYANWARIFDLGNGEDNGNILLNTESTTGRPSFSVRSGATSLGSLTAANPLPLNQWVHVAGVVQADRTTLLYVNGTSVATGSLTADAPTISRTSNFIGKSNWAADSLLNGSVADSRIWNTARTQAEIQSTMPVGSITGPTAGLLADYVYGVTGTAPTIDISGNSLTATQNGSITYSKFDSGTLTSGGFSGANTTLNVAQGTLNLTGSNPVNRVTVNTAALTQAGGMVSTSYFGDAFVIGESVGQAGTYTLTGGTVAVNSAGNLQVAFRGSGTMSQSGGNVSVSGYAVVGRYSGVTGVYNLSGGTLTQSDGTRRLIVGEEGTGTLTVSGSGSVVSSGGLSVSHASGGVGVVNLNGGTISALQVVKGGGNSATFNFNGGTLKAVANNGSFMTGLTTAALLSGGGRIDDGGFTITAGQVFSGTGSLVKTGAGSLSLTGANTFTGPLTVTAGELALSGTSAAGGTSLVSAVGSTAVLRLAGTNLFVGNHGTPVAAVIAADGGTILADSSADTRIGSVSLSNGAAFRSDRSLGAYDLLLANTPTGAATVTVANTGTSTAPATMAAVTAGRGIHLQGVQNFDVADVTSSTASDLTVSMVLAGPGSAGGAAGGVAKLGAGTMELTGANTYDGGTTVNLGTLSITGGSLANSASNTLTVNSGGVFSFGTTDVFTNHSGTVLPAVVVNQGGTVRNANSSYNTLGPVTLAGGTLESTGVASSSGQGFALKGTVTVNGTTTSTISGTGIGLGSDAVTSTTFSVADGAAATDLLVAGVLQNGPGPSYPTPQASSLVKTGSGTMVLAADNTYTGSTTISAGTLRVGTGGIAGRLGSGAVVNSGALVFNRSDALTAANTISGSGSVTKEGAGTLTLSGTNSYSGGTTVSAGRVIGTTSSLQGAVTNNAAVEFSQAGNGTYAGSMGGSGSLTKSGSGTVTLSGSNSYSGGTALDGGTLVLGSAGAIGSSGTISFGGGTLRATASNTTDYSGRFSTAAGQQYSIDTNGQNLSLAANLTSSGGSLTKVGAGNLTLTGTSSYSGGTTLTAGRLIGTTASLQGTIANGSIVVIDQATPGTFTGSLNGVGALEKAGVGTVVLTASSSHQGGTTVKAGTLAVTADGALGMPGATTGAIFGTGAGSNPASGSARDAHWNLVAVPSTWTPPTATPYPAYVLKEADPFWLGGNTSGVQNGYTVSGSTVYWISPQSTPAQLIPGTYNWIVAQEFNVLRDGEYAFSFGGAGDNEISFYIDGTINTSSPVLPVITGGQQIGTTWNSYTAIGTLSGTASLQAGTHTAYMLLRDFGGATGALITNSTFTPPAGTFVSAGATLDLRGVNYSTADAITLQGGTLETSSGSSSWAGSVAMTGSPTVSVTGDSLAILGGISGTASLTKSGAGALVLTGSNTYSGATVISSGTLQVGSGGTAGDLGGSGAIANDGVLAIDRSNAFSLSRSITGTGGFRQLGSGTTTLSGANSYSGGTVVAAGRLVGTAASVQGAITNDGTVEFAQASSGTYSGAMAGSGVLVKTGTGTLALTGDNTFTGGTVIASGTLSVGDGGASGSIGSGNVTNDAALVANRTGSLTIAAAISGTGSFRQLGSGTTTLSGNNTYTGTTTVSAGRLVGATASLPGAIANAAELEFAQASAGTFAAAISGTGSLTKTGVGNVTLSGTSTYTGATTVSAGRLSVNGVLGTTPVAVLASADLGGSGQIGGPVSIAAGGTLSPGNSIASLATGTATLAAGATYAYEVDSAQLGSLGTAADLLVVTGDLNLDLGNATLLTLTDLNGSPAPFVENTTVFAMINYSGTWNGGLFSVNGTPIADGGRFSVGSQLWELDYNSPTGGLNLTGDYLPSSSFVTVMAVPEPTTLALAASGAGLTVAAIRGARRRSRAKHRQFPD